MSRSMVSLLLVASCLVLYACSEATDGVVVLDGGPSSTEGGAAGDDDGGSSSSDGGGEAERDAGFVVGDAAVVINEIAASDEWVELVNGGTAALDVSGFVLADSLKDDAGPKLSDGVTFPKGTILSPRAYLVVQGGEGDAGAPPCPDGGQSYCFSAKFGISNKNGEALYLLDDQGAIVGKADYPANAAGGGDTWGRLPSGDPTAAFQVTVATPGAANVAK